jgi:NAD(P)-dependent dehydrogenase (short-subunit alcohol dehydrogenase family)
VLIFQGEGALSREIADRYITEGRDVIEVEIGDVFEEVSKNRYVISGNEEDYCKLMLLIKDRNICKILHMMTLDNYDCIETLDKLEESQQKGVMSLFYLTRAIVKAGIDREMDVVLISDYVTQVNGFEEKIKPENMTLFGMGKVVRKEQHNILCRCIDIDDNTKVQDVLAELEAESPWFNVAYRRGVRYVEEFREIDIDMAQDRKLEIKEGGIYVITGGAGGIGMEVAKYLASQNKVTLVLINRSSVPDRQDWESIQAKGEDENLIKKIKDIQEIEAKGSKIECYSANVSNSGEMGKILHDIRTKHGKINGVIHGAGVGGIEPIVNRRPEDFNRVFNPKVYGTWILDRLTREDELDFFIMFSSIATILSAPGQGDYTAANAYLDSFSYYRNMTGKRTITINWSIWRETGMCLTHDFSFDTVFKGLPTKEYIGCFDKLVNKDIPKALIGEINYTDSMVFLLEKYMMKLSA